MHLILIQENGKKVASKFKVDGNILSYEMGEYAGSIVIDPSLGWATYYGGTKTDYPAGTAINDSGNVYFVGYTISTTNIATVGAYQTTLGGAGYHDAFLVKFNSAGSLKWATYYGGTSDDIGESVAVDASDNVYITGYTLRSTSGIATAGAPKATNTGGG